MSDIYFTSDTHFGHANIIKYCKRPFANAYEMDETLILNWNARVRPNDEIYHLGDFGFGSEQYLHRILKRLNGKKHFIRGNHDKAMRGSVLDHFVWAKDYHKLKVGEQTIILFHYGIESWDKRHHGSWHLHGHSHGTLPSPDWQPRLDVGVDPQGFFPISFEQVKNHMSKKIPVTIDNHMVREL